MVFQLIPSNVSHLYVYGVKPPVGAVPLIVPGAVPTVTQPLLLALKVTVPSVNGNAGSTQMVLV